MKTVQEWCPEHGHSEFFVSDQGLCCPHCFADEYAYLVDAEAERGAAEMETRATLAGPR